MDNFHEYLKKQLIEYVESERSKGIPLEEIEKVLLDAGHRKNIIDEVFLELEKEKAGKDTKHADPVEKDMVSMLKKGFGSFMAQASNKEIKEAKEDFKNTDTNETIKEVIDDVEVIEEKNMMESALFFIYLVALTLIILFSTGSTHSEIKNVIIGFIPAVLSIFISFFALKLADNVPAYVMIPLGVASAFYGLARFSGLEIFRGIDPEGLAIVNFLLGFFFNILVVYIRFIKPKHMRRRVIKKQHRNNSPGIDALRQF
jgi:hypothetical protein